MLFSLTKKFLFIANLKTASTVIEKMLAPHADLRLLRSEFGKHLTFARFVKHFEYLAGRIDMNEVFVFGVMREPVDYVVSMYNSHSKERFRGIPNLYTGEMSFEQFLSRWAPDHPDQLRPQISRFTRANGDVAANFLISYDKLQEGLEVVAEQIKVPALTKLPRENESPRRVSRADLSADQIDWIEERLHKDVDAIRRHCNQLRFPERAPA